MNVVLTVINYVDSVIDSTDFFKATPEKAVVFYTHPCIKYLYTFPFLFIVSTAPSYNIIY